MVTAPLRLPQRYLALAVLVYLWTDGGNLWREMDFNLVSLCTWNSLLVALRSVWHSIEQQKVDGDEVIVWLGGDFFFLGILNSLIYTNANCAHNNVNILVIKHAYTQPAPIYSCFFFLILSDGTEKFWVPRRPKCSLLPRLLPRRHAKTKSRHAHHHRRRSLFGLASSPSVPPTISLLNQKKEKKKNKEASAVCGFHK